MRYKIKNWHSYQHYKDRCPPWIKLHHSLLTSEVWVMGNDATRSLAVASMLLASRNDDNDGTFNGDPEYVKRFAYLNTKPDFKPLIEYGFIELVQDASKTLAECNTEKSREEERREEKKDTRNSSLSKLTSLGVDEQVAKDWLAIRKVKKLPLTDTALNQIIEEAKVIGKTLPEIVLICAKNNWGSFKAKWEIPADSTTEKPLVCPKGYPFSAWKVANESERAAIVKRISNEP